MKKTQAAKHKQLVNLGRALGVLCVICATSLQFSNVKVKRNKQTKKANLEESYMRGSVN